MVTVETLPSSIARETRAVVFRQGVPHVPVFCANCGADGGFVPELMVKEGTGFVSYLCIPCGEKWGHLLGTMLIPDEAFWAVAQEVMLEEYGRVLSPDEQIIALSDSTSTLSNLAKDRPVGGRAR